MLTTQTSFSATQRLINARWPLWSAPMVGTNPTLFPDSRIVFNWFERSFIVTIIFT